MTLPPPINLSSICLSAAFPLGFVSKFVTSDWYFPFCAVPSDPITSTDPVGKATPGSVGLDIAGTDTAVGAIGTSEEEVMNR